MFFANAGPLNQLELALRLRIHRARTLAGRGDRGASAVEWVIITSVLIIIVGVVGTIIYNKVQTAANGLNVKPNVGGGGGGGGP